MSTGDQVLNLYGTATCRLHEEGEQKIKAAAKLLRIGSGRALYGYFNWRYSSGVSAAEKMWPDDLAELAKMKNVGRQAMKIFRHATNRVPDDFIVTLKLSRAQVLRLRDRCNVLLGTA